MKQVISLAIVLSLVAGLLSSCGLGTQPPDPPVAELSAADLALEAVAASGRAAEDLRRVDQELDGDSLITYVENYYSLSAEDWTDCAILTAGGADAYEVTVFRLSSEADSQETLEGLENYLFTREGDFTGYAPEQAAIVSGGLAVCQDGFGALFICEDAQQALDGFLAALSGEPAPSPVPSDDAFPQRSADELARAAVSAAGYDPDSVLHNSDWLTPEDLSDTFGLEENSWSDQAIYSENLLYIAVFRFPDSAGASGAEEALSAYVEAQLDYWTRDLGGQHGVPFYWTARLGQYAVLLQAATAQEVKDAWSGLRAALDLNDRDIEPITAAGPMGETATYPGRVTFVPPNVDDMTIYDTSAILDAWDSGNPSGLSEYDRAIYDAASGVVNSALKAGMSDYEKECALYLWILTHVEYDYDHQDTLLETDPASFTPYGGLVNGKAVCLGFATTFQLLMDMASVECITVVGASSNSTADHAWNMVRLDGQWYCVDATWDMTYYNEANGATPWFNVTSDYMAETDHQWDYDNVPEAVNTFSAPDPQAEPTPTPAPTSIPAPTPEPTPDFSDRYSYSDPQTDDMTIYDTSAILSAWDSGDPSALSEYDRAIYDKAKEVLEDILSDGMSDYEKEFAIYQWVVDHVSYDQVHYDNFDAMDHSSYTPYGGLIRGEAVCLGFATTFQLLMDMAGVECITVVGAAYYSQENHAWNMVRLNDQWYCADPTWDTGVLSWFWSYFNVTSDYMARTNHQWAYGTIPEATATDGGKN